MVYVGKYSIHSAHFGVVNNPQFFFSEKVDPLCCYVSKQDWTGYSDLFGVSCSPNTPLRF